MAFWDKNRSRFKHHPNIPESFRMLIVGASGCGKTNLLFNMLLLPDFLDYDNLIIFSKTSQQPEYQLLYHGLKNGLSKQSLIKIFENQKSFSDNMTIEEICSTYSSLYKEDNNISIQMFQKTDQIMNPSVLNTNKKNLIIFDDCVNMKNQSVIESYCTKACTITATVYIYLRAGSSCLRNLFETTVTSSYYLNWERKTSVLYTLIYFQTYIYLRKLNGICLHQIIGTHNRIHILLSIKIR